MAVVVNKAAEPAPTPARTVAGLLLLLLLVSVTASLSEALSDECFGDTFYNCYVATDKHENVESMQRCCDLANADKDCACLWATTPIHFNLPLPVFICAVDSCGGN